MSDGERRMVFDTRGRRKNVIRVVYAVLALLMGASLFLVIGPFNLGEIAGNSGGSSASEALSDRVERIEARLVKSPDDEDLLLTLTRAQISAGNAALESETGAASNAARQDFRDARESWGLYLEATDEPNPAAAQLVATTLFTLAERGSNTIPEIQKNVSEAAAAQQIAVEEQPSLGSVSSLAIYRYFEGNNEAGDRATKRAASMASSKAEAASIEKQLDAYRTRGNRFVSQVEKIAKAQAQAGRTQLGTNPFESLGPPGAVLGE